MKMLYAAPSEFMAFHILTAVFYKSINNFFPLTQDGFLGI